MSFGLFNINYNSDTFLFILAKVEQNGAFELDVTSRIRVTKKSTADDVRFSCTFQLLFE